MFKPMLTSGNAQGGVIYSDSNSLEIVFRKGALEYNFAFTHITPRNEKTKILILALRIFQIVNY